MILIASSLFLCTFVIHLYVRADTFCIVPKLLKLIFIDILANFYCMLPKVECVTDVTVQYTADDNIDKFELVEKRFKKYRQLAIESLISSSHKDECNSISEKSSQCLYCGQQLTLSNEIERLNKLENHVKQIFNCLKETREKIEKKEHGTQYVNDWKTLALVLDRTFFLIFLFITFVTLIVMRNSF